MVATSLPVGEAGVDLAETGSDLQEDIDEPGVELPAALAHHHGDGLVMRHRFLVDPLRDERVVDIGDRHQPP